jgi:hypothetical protein
MEVTPQAPPQCPFCDEQDDVELVSPNGGQLITAHWLCNACHTYFEAIRDDFDANA